MNMAVQASRSDDEQIEDEIVRKDKIAARVTPADIQSAIYSEHYFTAEHGVEGAMAALQLYQVYNEVDTAAGEHGPSQSARSADVLRDRFAQWLLGDGAERVREPGKLRRGDRSQGRAAEGGGSDLGARGLSTEAEATRCPLTPEPISKRSARPARRR
ncbi:hypothetical protein [Burkholderia aenigmatica]|uniref:hypothetical protein n=1 Tax=Burkholderia aenigmatica TaxID=2015348 RepID=UPI003F5190C1